MDDEEFRQIYKLNRDQLTRYYERIKNRLEGKEEVEIIANFLKHQSIIETTIDEIIKILTYYEKKSIKTVNLLDLAFEWIRANEIRLKYKKYLIRTSYPEEKIALAVDDCISRIFLDYDIYIRKFFKKIEEHEISALFHIIFSRLGEKKETLEEILSWHKEKVPTYEEEGKRICTNLITLRSGLSQIIVEDYESVVASRQASKLRRDENVLKTKEIKIEPKGVFQGLLLERMIKSYCISKNKLSIKEIENAIAQFLSSYFRFGVFYEFNEFKDLLIKNFSEDLHSGLTDAYKRKFTLEELKEMISETMKKFRAINKIKVLDGSAWKNDLTKYLKNFLVNFSDDLFQPKKIIALVRSPSRTLQESTEIQGSESPDFRALFDLDLEIEDFRAKLEKSLENSDLGFVKKQSLIRSKVQEFRMEKRKQMSRTPKS
ncbi:MAG: hypothetical protein JW891_16980 [Candidatus Lokiarchaeota archaeon]|nr:hypothetical protein [Candidatus Lokiarchaeota archaeon]